MATSFKIPSGGTDGWLHTSAADKIQLRSGSNDSVRELKRSADLYTDLFDDTPFTDRMSQTKLNTYDGNWMSWAAGWIGSTYNRILAYCNNVSTFQDGLLESEIKTNDTRRGETIGGIAARVDAANKTCYFAGFNIMGEFVIAKWVNNVYTLIAGSGEQVSGQQIGVGDTTMKVKFYLDGTTLKAKHWGWSNPDGEPMSGGPDGDGYQISTTDSSITDAGSIGVINRHWTGSGYVKFNYLKWLGTMPSDLPVLYTHYDTGQDGTVIANGAKLKVLQNVAAGDLGSIKCKLCVGETEYKGDGGDSDCTAVDALLNDSWLVIDENGEITVPAEMSGRHVNIVYQLNSDGFQQTSLADCGEALTVALAAGSTPGTPEITGLTAGDTEVTVALTADDEADLVYARYRLPDGDWAAESETFRRTGSGDITITGLTNGQRYQIGIYIKVAGVTSDWDFGWARPTDGSNDPAGMISLPLHYLRKMVSESSSFQDWLEVESAEEALARIFPVSTTAYTLPYATVDWAENYRRAFHAGGARHHFLNEGDLILRFRGPIDSEHTESEAAYVFLNKIGEIIEDIESLAGTGGYLGITGMSLEAGPERPNEDEEKSTNDFYQITFRVEY